MVWFLNFPPTRLKFYFFNFRVHHTLSDMDLNIHQSACQLHRNTEQKNTFVFKGAIFAMNRTNHSRAKQPELYVSKSLFVSYNLRKKVKKLKNGYYFRTS